MSDSVKFLERKPFPDPHLSLKVPKIFNLADRRFLAETYDKWMEVSNLDYYELATKKIDLFGQEYQVYPNLNLQMRVTRGCTSQCGTCIEKFDIEHYPESDDEALVERIDLVINKFMENGIFPSGTISGGEPTENPNRLKKVLTRLNHLCVHKYNLNTNGLRIDQELGEFLYQNGLPYLNISMHHWDGDINRTFFKNPKAFGMDHIADIGKWVGGGTWGMTPRIRMQCMVLKGQIDSVETMEQYIDQAIDVGVDNVAFRGLSELSCGKYDVETVSLPMIIDSIQLSRRDGWEFVCQNIADWYLYEDWKYKGVDVHFNLSDMKLLKNFEIKERARGLHYGREFVVYEDAAFAGSWNRKMSLILPGK